jgi:hypothetical protein
MANTALPCFLSVMILLVLPAWGGDKEKDEETLKNEANVLQKMLNSNSVPADVLAKADCTARLRRTTTEKTSLDGNLE